MSQFKLVWCDALTLFEDATQMALARKAAIGRDIDQ